MFCLRGSSKLGALLLTRADGALSATPKEMISTMLDTSFKIRSGSADGSSFPTSLRLHRYMATANSGKSNCPDLVVSERVLSSKLEMPAPKYY